MARRCELPRPTFQHRFKRATGHRPARYVQNLRVEEAKCLLERTGDPVDEIGWKVGYEEAAAFRRALRRITSLSPGEDRRKFRAPGMALARAR